MKFLFEYGTDVLFIFVVYIAGRLAIKKASDHIRRWADDADDSVYSGKEKRADTMVGFFRTAGSVTLYALLAMMILRLFGVDATAILAGAGIVGFAVGFGTQSMVKDFIAGIFVFVENQCAIGDLVRIDDKYEGVVERMSIRTLTIRVDHTSSDDGEGNTTEAPGYLMFIPNGSIKNIKNFSLMQRTPQSVEKEAGSAE